MKFFTNKSIWSKIIIVLIFVLLFEFVVTKPTLGADEVADTLEFGGKLLGPILSLVVTIGDAIIATTQSALMGSPEALIPIDMELTFWQVLGAAVVWVVAAAVGVALVALTGGLMGPLLVAIAIGTYGSSFVINEAAADRYQRNGYFLF